MTMRRYLYIAVLTLLFCSGVAHANNGPGYLFWASFNTASGKSYIETYLTIIGDNVKYVKSDGNSYHASVNIDISFWQGDSLVTGNKYNLHGPATDDSLKKENFIDVQRYWLKEGTYTMKFIISDANDTLSKPLSVIRKIKVGYNKDSVDVGGIEFLQSYEPSTNTGILNKCGYKLVPYVSDYYPSNMDKLEFYTEVYNAYKIGGPDAKFVLKYFIESNEGNTPLHDYSSISVKKADTLNPVLGGFNIKNLPSGNYNLVVQVIDKDDKIRASKKYTFIRYVPGQASIDINSTFVAKYNDRDTLMDYIKSLSPIASLSQKDFIENASLSKSDITVLKEFLYNFWVSQNPTDPQGAWQQYLAQVEAVNRTFGTYGMKGYQTDRGRVYLQYGPPNQRVQEDMNPSSYPYEIWEYYKLKNGQVDRKFVFYNPDIVTNNYVLLHSDAKGEVQNRQWQMILRSRSGQPANVDQDSTRDPYGENTMYEFNNPH